MACDRTQSMPHYHWLVKQHKLQAQHGPIELLIHIDGDLNERTAAFEQAVAFFDTVLVSLVDELPLLRSPASTLHKHSFHSIVGQCMSNAVKPFSDSFVTPMASVAGSVAQCVLAALCNARVLKRAFVNNGGDIALYLNTNAQYTVGICDDLKTAKQGASASINSTSCVRGIATSGWQGRSHSLGIANAVTVLSDSAATADVAATLIANHITITGCSKIHSVPANELLPDSDLGTRAVTVAVDQLHPAQRQQALSAGEHYAQLLCNKGLIDSAYLSLQGQQAVVGHSALNHWRDSA